MQKTTITKETATTTTTATTTERKTGVQDNTFLRHDEIFNAY
jgi:hypothetical protein